MIAFIFCMSQNRVIGKDNDLPWRLPADLQFFKSKTSGHTILMGRRTYESMGRPLPHRENVVLTRDKGFAASGCHVIHSKEKALRLERELEEKGETLFVIGGQAIFEMFMDEADIIYLTIIYEDFAGDTYFPELDENWSITARKKGIKNDKNPYDYEFLTYEKK
jgi:dihydrofolate reductase